MDEPFVLATDHGLARLEAVELALGKGVPLFFFRLAVFCDRSAADLSFLDVLGVLGELSPDGIQRELDGFVG